MCNEICSTLCLSKRRITCGEPCNSRVLAGAAMMYTSENSSYLTNGVLGLPVFWARIQA